MTSAVLMLLFLTMPMLQSCLDDWDDKDNPLFAIGTVKVIEERDYYFALDEGSKLYPGDTTYVHNYAVVDGQRAFVYFDELTDKVAGYEYNAKIRHIENILTKDIYFMPAEKNDSIGDDRINATDSCYYTEVKDLVSVIGDLDVLYMTRVQKERFFNEDDYLRLRDTYILYEAKMAYAKKDMAVLHPLPRVNEIAVEVDDDPRAAYFEQVKNGMLMRMALESSVVGDELPGYEPLESKEVAA